MNSRNTIRVAGAVDVSAKGKMGAGIGDVNDAGAVGVAGKLLGWVVGADSCFFVALVRFFVDDGMVAKVLGIRIAVRRVAESENAVSSM